MELQEFDIKPLFHPTNCGLVELDTQIHKVNGAQQQTLNTHHDQWNQPDCDHQFSGVIFIPVYDDKKAPGVK